MKFKIKLVSIPIYVQIFIGMLVGIALGMIALYAGFDRFIQNWIQPWGQLFIRLLQLIAVPLVIVSLINGLFGLKDISAFARLGWRALIFYFLLLLLAIGIGMSAGLLVKPGAIVDKTKIENNQKAYQTAAMEKDIIAEQTKGDGPLAFLNTMVPSNIFDAVSNNANMLQVIFFVLCFGFAALTIKPEKIQPIADLFDGLNEVILKMVDYIIRLAPIGVAALMAGIVTDFEGEGSIFSALGVYALTVVGALMVLMFVLYPLFVHFFTNISVKKFMKEMYPLQLFAFTTSSSAATLPVTMNVAENKLGISKDIVSFILPVGTTINMDGTSLYQTLAVLFIAQVLGIDLSITQMLVVVGMCVLSSIGTPAIPGGSFVILSIVLASVGIPAEGLALILGIDRPLDMLRTSVNVTGDVLITASIDKKTVKTTL
jgi:Na+/H+-dicarboxylate symporter